MVTKAPTAKPAVKSTTAASAATAARKPATKAPVKPATRPAPKAALKPAPATSARPARPAPKPAPKAAIKPVAPQPAAPAGKADKKAAKPKKVKQVRDSFTMPENEYAVLAQVKKTCLKAGVEIKKSDLLRIGVSLIKNLKIADIKDILAGLTPLKVGRPKK
ncbi:hypothetical protein [Herbaspirillum sp. YR522]|uniref:hypothetical protein n=1 Tax=Herbaspirillum sp. YR522 TaxID=1144342 RepID=UPI00026F8845|nr:hypothetical protein [Herbaspirillum sp. YR522]EJN06940.1 hypothetical protein PMI40_02125 [Herbaspirillum sp. YR522]